jgi:hypothetical protein
LAALAKETGFSLYYLITGEGDKMEKSIYNIIDEHEHLTDNQKSNFKALIHSFDEPEKTTKTGS